MGKKKAVSKTNPDALKEAGNKAFGLGSFEEAIKFYTQAIELAQNHVYYANRANAYLELTEFDKCIQDCNEAIKIDPGYIKSYIRKGNAELSSSLTKQSIQTFEKALALDKDNLEIQTLLAEAK